MAEGKVQEAPAMTFPKTREDTLALPPPPAQDELPLPPPKEAFSKFYQQRQANELRRLYRHIHPELRKNLEEAVVKDLAEVLEAEEPTEGDVQSMRWIFENWSLDAIGDHPPPQRPTNSEAVPAGDVRATSKKFEDGSFTTTDQAPAKPGPIRGDVQTVRWLFETQPMDTLTSQTDIQKAVLREPPPSGDVQSTRTLFETRPLDSLGCQPSAQEQSPLQLRSEIQELKGDVKKTVKLFQTEPLCAIQDAEGGIHEVKAACREEIQSTAVRTARWLFETKPLDAINRDPSQVRVIRGISLEEAARPDISNTRWLFETQPLDAIREITIDEKDFQPSPDLIPPGPDVQQQRMLFETRALDTLKGDEAPEEDVAAKEDVIGGDVRSTLWLFETQALGTPSSEVQVGRLQQVRQQENEKGTSENAGFELEKCSGHLASSQFPARDKEGKGDVKAFKKLFETLPLDSIGQKSPVPTDESKLKEVASAGQVQATQALFEKGPLYAIQDGHGGLHALTSVSREQVVGGDVQGSRWMFETQPLDRLGHEPEKVDVIRGITCQEVMAGDVSSARWLFETQPLEVIHQQKKEKEEKEEEPPSAVPLQCNVQTIRWLFETHPIHALAQSRPDVIGTSPQADVQSYTWMFETQPREGPEGPGEQHLQVRQASPQTKDQQMETHIFETSQNLMGQDPIHYCSRVEIPVGQVSRRKEAFEAPVVTKDQKEQRGSVAPPESVVGGSVRKFTWLFENCPMDCLEKAVTGGIQEMPPEKDVAATAASGKRFVFETCSLGELPDEVDERELQRIEKKALARSPSSSHTLRFESQPLYVLPDRQGQLHEVTAVKKEEVRKADTCGARWIFETRPLTQRLGVGEEIFVLRAVTQEDICQGELKAARWKFETEPLEQAESMGKGKADPQMAKGEPVGRAPSYMRTVSLSDTQQGNVRTSTWLFENRPLDTLKGSDSEASATPEPALSVQRQDSRRGDVKRCTWLFETQPLDQLQEPVPQEEVPREKLPRADVKSTTWLFESTPLDQLHDSTPQEERPREQVPQADVKGTTRLFESKPLDHLNAQQDGEAEQRQTAAGETLVMLHGTPGVLQKGGILIEAHTARTVRMAKYQLPSPGEEQPQVQKEDVVLGELPRILRRVIQGPDVAPQGLLVQEDEAGLLKLEPLPLSTLMDGCGHKVWDLLAWSHTTGGTRTGLVIQETDQGLVKLLVYSLRLRLGSQAASGTAERASVQLLASCIEKGDLDSLKSLQWEPPTESHSPAEEAATPSQTPLTASSVKKIIHVTLPEGGIGCPKSTGPVSTNLLTKEAWVSPGPQKAPVTPGNLQGAPSGTPGVPGPDLQVAMQNLRQVTAEAQTLQHQMQSKHKTRDAHPAQEPIKNGQPQEPAPQSNPTPRTSRVVMPDIQMTSVVRSKVSAGQEEPSEGSLRGRVAIQDGIYTAKPIRTFMPHTGAPPAKGELEASPQPGTFLSRAPTPPSARGLEVGSGPGREGSRGCVQAALESLGKANMNVCKGDIRAALIYQDAARRVSAPSPSQAVGPSQLALNNSPPPPAAVTGPEFSSLPGPEDNAPTPQKPYVHLLSPVSGQRHPERPEAESPKQETAVMGTRKKPALPPKPAHLGGPSQILPLKHPALLSSPAVTGAPGEVQSLTPAHQTSGHPEGHLSERQPPSLITSTSKTSEKEVVVNSVEAMGSRMSPCTPAMCKDDPVPLQGPRRLPRQELPAEPGADQQKPLEEIPQGHVQGAKEIFENLKKQEELQAILSRVRAIEEDAVRGVDVKALQSLFEAVPEWVEKRTQAPDPREACPGLASPPGTKGVSSVELAFGDLARASAEVACLKEQTLARLLDIEKAICKALSSVSSLQPEADISGLSGLLQDRLGEEPSNPAPRQSSVAKVSIQSSSKVESEQTGREGREGAKFKGQAEAKAQAKAQKLTKVENQASVKAQPRGLSENLKTELGFPRVLPSRVNSPSSPSYITIESAARRPAESPSPGDSPDISHLSRDIAHSLPPEGIPADRGHRELRQVLGQSEPSPGASPLFPRRQKSVLELQTGPRGSQLYGATRTVMEQYEEMDPFGNKIITSSTTVTKQADSPASRSPSYEVCTSPLLRRYLQSTSRANGTLHEGGMVCVTFANSRPTTN